MFSVTTPAADKTLLTAAELRAAIGLADGDTSKDAVLTTIGAAAALIIARECTVPASGGNEPTLRSEGITETWRVTRCQELLLPARRFVSAITSISVDGTAIGISDFEADPSNDFIFRLVNDCRAVWRPSKVTAVYTAGFATVPPDLKQAAKKIVSDIYTTASRDPNLKRVKIDGVSEREYWVGPVTDPSIPQEVRDLLAPYSQIRVA